MMMHRYDISDEIWNKINVNLSESAGHTGRSGVDNRRFINAVFWILRTGVPWRNLRRSLAIGKIRIGDLQGSASVKFGTKY